MLHIYFTLLSAIPVDKPSKHLRSPHDPHSQNIKIVPHQRHHKREVPDQHPRKVQNRGPPGGRHLQDHDGNHKRGKDGKERHGGPPGGNGPNHGPQPPRPRSKGDKGPQDSKGLKPGRQ
eukprot:NODE_75_length_23955_cov_0.435069.p23 type:complete len:119 gc:universal NODE_75_length_23955_cov_0.435069:4337-3981(-)